MVTPDRRNFIQGGLALLAAPALVRASSLMPIRGAPLVLGPQATINQLLTADMIVRETIEIFCRSNAFLKQFNEDFEEAAKFGVALRIRAPNDFLVVDRIPYADMLKPGVGVATYNYLEPEFPSLPAPLAAAIAAPVVVDAALKLPVSRRFWRR